MIVHISIRLVYNFAAPDVAVANRSLAAGTDGWWMATEVYAGRVQDFADGQRVMVTIGTRDVFVFERGGRFYAFENVCRHMGGPVGEGMLIGKVESVLDEEHRHVRDRFSTSEIHIVCPWHGWEYDIETGECAANRRIRLRRFDAVERGGEVYVSG